MMVEFNKWQGGLSTQQCGFRSPVLVRAEDVVSIGSGTYGDADIGCVCLTVATPTKPSGVEVYVCCSLERAREKIEAATSQSPEYAI